MIIYMIIIFWIPAAFKKPLKCRHHIHHQRESMMKHTLQIGILSLSIDSVKSMIGLIFDFENICSQCGSKA